MTLNGAATRAGHAAGAFMVEGDQQSQPRQAANRHAFAAQSRFGSD